MNPLSPVSPSAWDALTHRVAMAPLPDLMTVGIRGESRRTFLNNFCTADIRKLAEGSTCEAMILNERGKILCWGHVLALPHHLEMIAWGGDFEAIVQHLDRYNFRSDVELFDAAAGRAHFFLAGPLADRCVADRLGGTLDTGACREISEGGQELVSGIELAGPGYLVRSETPDRWAVAVAERGGLQVETAALEPFRIGHGTPRNGEEVGPEHLPQELRRDDRAISFEKGCYLGQETVARIDALGHVNQFLTFLSLDGEGASGDTLKIDDRPVGQITSFSPNPEQPGGWGLGFVRRQFLDQELDVVRVDGTRGGKAHPALPPLAAQVTGGP